MKEAALTRVIVDIIKELPVSPSGARAVLVKGGDRYFVVSSVVAPFSGFETLVFPADAEGLVTDFGEVAGGRGLSREEAIGDLEGRLTTGTLDEDD